MEHARLDVPFESGDATCAGWFYRPARGDDLPVVVLAPDLTARRTWRLPRIAHRFAERGVAAFTFDYRHFGDSDGEPRRLVDPAAQADDLAAAVDRVRRLDRVDPGRVAVWGTGLGGGHAVEVAARVDPAAVVAVAPLLDGKATVSHVLKAGGAGHAARVGLAVVRDLSRKYTRRSPHELRVVGDPDEFALLARPGQKRAFLSLVPADEEWTNRTPARGLLALRGYRPLDAADEVDCPAFVVEATEDDVVPDGPVDDLVDALDDVTRVREPVRHFDVLRDDAFERILDRARTFLDDHVVEPAAASASARSTDSMPRAERY
jgi:dienelactone hydrolase